MMSQLIKMLDMGTVRNKKCVQDIQTDLSLVPNSLVYLMSD